MGFFYPEWDAVGPEWEIIDPEWDYDYPEWAGAPKHRENTCRVNLPITGEIYPECAWIYPEWAEIYPEWA